LAQLDAFLGSPSESCGLVTSVHFRPVRRSTTQQPRTCSPGWRQWFRMSSLAQPASPQTPNRQYSPRHSTDEQARQTDEYPEPACDVGRAVSGILRSRLHVRRRHLQPDSNSSAEPDERTAEWQTKTNQYGSKPRHVNPRPTGSIRPLWDRNSTCRSDRTRSKCQPERRPRNHHSPDYTRLTDKAKQPSRTYTLASPRVTKEDLNRQLRLLHIRLLSSR
jgi:hypothetical protein